MQDFNLPAISAEFECKLVNKEGMIYKNDTLIL